MTYPGGGLPPTWAVPITAGRLIERTLKVWWHQVWRFAALMLVVYLPIVLVASGGAIGLDWRKALGGGAPPEWLLLLAVAVGLLLLVPVGFAVLGGISVGVLQHLAGQPVTLRGMAGLGLRRASGVGLAAMLAGLASIGGYLLLFVPGIMVATATCLVVPVVVAERRGPSEAFRRSLDLTRGLRWSLFAAFLGVAAVQFGASMLANLVQLVSPVAGALTSLSGSVLFGSMTYVLCSVAYHDVRGAKEGFDTGLAKVFE